MAAPLVQQGATVVCSHGGQAQPTAPNPRVTLAGQPSIVTSAPWTVAGCTLPPASGGPCVTAQWTSGTVRVTSVGQPLVVATGSATCLPTGVPLQVALTQARVTAS
jgi:hypothetical protein